MGMNADAKEWKGYVDSLLQKPNQAKVGASMSDREMLRRVFGG